MKVNEMEKLDYRNLTEEYKNLLIERLHDFGFDYEVIEKRGWQKLEEIYEKELRKRVRVAYDPEPCKFCGFPYRQKYAYSKCPRCGK